MVSLLAMRPLHPLLVAPIFASTIAALIATGVGSFGVIALGRCDATFGCWGAVQIVSGFLLNRTGSRGT